VTADDRAGLLDEAKGYVTKDRNASYGEPEDNFSNIAEIWNAQGVSVNGRPVDSTDVALMMVGMKLARLKHNPTHRDSWVDTAGYVACGWDTAKGLNTPKPPEEHVQTFRAMLEEVNERVAADGWISDNRCGNARDHEPHPYDRYDGNKGPAYFCDGYVLNHQRNQRRDIEAVQRAADKQRKASDPGTP
jgi:hypothetical protein